MGLVVTNGIELMKKGGAILSKRNTWKCNQTDLYNAKKGCDGVIVSASGGGIKCTKCSGWFCY